MRIGLFVCILGSKMFLVIGMFSLKSVCNPVTVQRILHHEFAEPLAAHRRVGIVREAQHLVVATKTPRSLATFDDVTLLNFPCPGSIFRIE